MCDSIQRAKFMFRLGKSIGRDKTIIVTGEPIVKVLAFRKGFNCRFIRSSSSNNKINVNISNDFLNSIELLNGELDESECINDILSIYGEMLQINSDFNVSHIIIWNGQQVFGRALTQFAHDHKIKKVYLEIPNLPNKLFADPSGVNALSSIVDNKDKIINLPSVDCSVHSKWVEIYKEAKKKPLPQAKRNISDLILGLFNRVIKNILSGVGFRRIRIKELSGKLSMLKGESIDLSEDFNKFAFLPLQVSSDTQIKLHSEVDNIQAIKIAYQECQNSSLKLVVKIHPAEFDDNEIGRILNLRNELNFSISNENTISLIERASKIFTINSTVGLEGLIFGKEVITLGRAYYSWFDESTLSKYIHGYLIDGVDYFSDLDISRDDANKILSYAG